MIWIQTSWYCIPTDSSELHFPKTGADFAKICFQWILQISAFFLFSKFQKRQIALYSHSPLVGWRHHYFFSIYRGIKGQFYQPGTTYYHTVPSYTDLVSPSTNQYCPILTQYHPIPATTALYWPSTNIYQCPSRQNPWQQFSSRQIL